MTSSTAHQSWNATDAANAFVALMVADNQPPTRIAASAVGGVGVSRQVGDRLAYVEFYNDGRVFALLADDGPTERVFEVTDFGRLLREIKEHTGNL